MEETLKETGEGRRRMQRSEARIDRRLADHLERQEEARNNKEARRENEGGGNLRKACGQESRASQMRPYDQQRVEQSEPELQGASKTAIDTIYNC